MPRFTPERITEIQNHLALLDAGDWTVAELAAEIGVSAPTLYQWRRRFGPTITHDDGADLIEVDVARHGSSTIEIVIGSVTVRVPPAFDVTQLRSVLEIVSSC